jgi:hypothetical protein
MRRRATGITMIGLAFSCRPAIAGKIGCFDREQAVAGAADLTDIIARLDNDRFPVSAPSEGGS